VGQRNDSAGIFQVKLGQSIVNEPRRLYVHPIKPDADVKRRLIDPSPVHYFQLLFYPRGHPRRREQLDPRTPNAKAVDFVNYLFVLVYMKFGPAIVLVWHPMVMDVDDEALLGHDVFL
jgi:hypothetical protein